MALLKATVRATGCSCNGLSCAEMKCIREHSTGKLRPKPQRSASLLGEHHDSLGVTAPFFMAFQHSTPSMPAAR